LRTQVEVSIAFFKPVSELVSEGQESPDCYNYIP
jgi:hypothetical protein